MLAHFSSKGKSYSRRSWRRRSGYIVGQKTGEAGVHGGWTLPAGDDERMGGRRGLFVLDFLLTARDEKLSTLMLDTGFG
jgi:hypothetical protein